MFTPGYSFEKINVNFKDSSYHYYNTKKNKVFSYNYLYDYWYTSVYSELLELLYINQRKCYYKKHNLITSTL